MTVRRLFYLCRVSINKSIQAEISFFKHKLLEYEERGLKVFASSSFQGHSIPMLEIISSIAPETPIFFLDTGFHFPETLSFRNQVTDRFHLNTIDLTSPIPKSGQMGNGNRLMFATDPDTCCFMNKTLPMEPVLKEYDVWISGLRADQNSHRKNLAYEASTPQGAMRFHPMLNWTQEMIDEYIDIKRLPKHPLEEKGYRSIGCLPCTQVTHDSRDGRWAGMKKTECGLHTELIEK